jgi:hypothetical protein
VPFGGIFMKKSTYYALNTITTFSSDGDQSLVHVHKHDMYVPRFGLGSGRAAPFIYCVALLATSP